LLFRFVFEFFFYVRILHVGVIFPLSIWSIILPNEFM
jgi:hypothetical protein